MVSQHRSQEFLASTGDLTGLLSLEEGTNQALKRVTDLAASLEELRSVPAIPLAVNDRAVGALSVASSFK